MLYIIQSRYVFSGFLRPHPTPKGLPTFTDGILKIAFRFGVGVTHRSEKFKRHFALSFVKF